MFPLLETYTFNRNGVPAVGCDGMISTFDTTKSALAAGVSGTGVAGCEYPGLPLLLLLLWQEQKIIMDDRII